MARGEGRGRRARPPARRPPRPDSRADPRLPARAPPRRDGPRGRRPRLPRHHDHRGRQVRLGLDPRLLRALRVQGGVLPRRLRRRPRSPRRADLRRRGRRARLAPPGDRRPARRASSSSPPNPTSPASACSSRSAPRRRSRSASARPSSPASPLSPAAAPSSPTPTRLLPETESSILGGIVSLATRSIVAGETEKLPDLLPDLADFTLSPYLGAERAAELAACSRST